MTYSHIIPHFVADRPMSLRILAGLPFERHPVKVGLMFQACTTENFRAMASQFPCGDLEYCGVADGECPFDGDISRCTGGLAVRNSITTIADSGVFTKAGAALSYPELFERYDQMNVERGIILDVLRDCDKTLESADLAMTIYSQLDCNFKLVGVAQGKNPDEYAYCYEKLKKIGFEEVAIGGLLKKKENTARYASSNKMDIIEIVRRIKSEWPDERCFTLGVYNPKRHEFLEELGVDAADYKGWIFQYKRRFEDPKCHHIDRVFQTRGFIEENVLSRMSGVEASCDPIKTAAERVKNHIFPLKTKVIVKREDDVAHQLQEPNSIVIISCGKSKIEVTSCAAKEAYIGRSFLLKRRYAEISDCPWFILSAKYGLIRPDDIINPNYDMVISTKTDSRNLATKIAKQIPHYLEFALTEEIIFLGPSAYYTALELALADGGYNIKHLTKGLKQGQSEKKIKKLLSELEGMSISQKQISSTCRSNFSS